MGTMKYLLALLTYAGFAFAEQPYNVLVFLVDDLGNDYTYRNTDPTATIPDTPRMRTLADEGVYFTDFRSSQQCAQTRAAFLTGRYSYRTGVNFVGAELPLTEYTLADDLKANHGYTAGMVGKWNLGGIELNEQDHPRTHGGFDYFAGSYPVSQYRAPHFATPKTINGSEPVNNAADKYLLTDEIDDAIAWTGTATEPWFMHVCIHAPHFSGPAQYLYPPVALQRNFTGTPNTDGGAHAYAAMIEALDTEFGRLIDSVDLDQTIVVFVGDNGSAHANGVVPVGRIKSTDYDNAVRTPLIIRAPGAVSPGRDSTLLCTTVDLYPTLVKLATGSAAASPNTIDGRDVSGVLRGEYVPSARVVWNAESIADDPIMVTDGTYRLIERGATADEFYHVAADPLESNDIGTSGLTGPALKAYNNLRYALTTFTAKTDEQAVVVADYTAPSVTTGSVAVTSGGITVVRPTITTPATITAPTKDGATTYTLWKKVGDFGTWQDPGLTPAIDAEVVFTDPTPTGRTYYRITNNAPEP
jgi:arylsulfatase A-like enzyme